MRCLSFYSFLWILGFIVSTHYFLNPAMAMADRQVTCGYDLILNGDDVGDISTTRIRDLDDATTFVQTSFTIRLTGWFGNYDLALSGEVTVDSIGIVKFDNTITEDKKTFKLVGERYNNELWCNAREVLTQKEQEDVAVIGLAGSVAASAIPYASEVLTALSLLGNGNGEQGELRIPLELFETTVTMLPAFLLKNKDSLKNISVRILDTTELEIETAIFEQTGKENITIAGRTFLCNVFSAKTPEGQSIYWLAEDSLGVFLVKETGKDGDGSYEIRLNEYKISEEIE